MNNTDARKAPVSTLGKAKNNCPLNLSQVIHKAEILVNTVYLDIFQGKALISRLIGKSHARFNALVQIIQSKMLLALSKLLI